MDGLTFKWHTWVNLERFARDPQGVENEAIADLRRYFAPARWVAEARATRMPAEHAASVVVDFVKGRLAALQEHHNTQEGTNYADRLAAQQESQLLNVLLQVMRLRSNSWTATTDALSAALLSHRSHTGNQTSHAQEKA